MGTLHGRWADVGSRIGEAPRPEDPHPNPLPWGEGGRGGPAIPHGRWAVAGTRFAGRPERKTLAPTLSRRSGKKGLCWCVRPGPEDPSPIVGEDADICLSPRRDLCVTRGWVPGRPLTGFGRRRPNLPLPQERGKRGGSLKRLAPRTLPRRRRRPLPEARPEAAPPRTRVMQRSPRRGKERRPDEHVATGTVALPSHTKEEPNGPLTSDGPVGGSLPERGGGPLFVSGEGSRGA